jgi:hypothetical protein
MSKQIHYFFRNIVILLFDYISKIVLNLFFWTKIHNICFLQKNLNFRLKFQSELLKKYKLEKCSIFTIQKFRYGTEL